MKNYIKWASIAIAITLVIGSAALFVVKLFTHKDKVVDAPEPTKSVEAIMDENKSDLENIKVDKSSIKSAKGIYSTIHALANTLIVAEDGLIWGQAPINEQSIKEAMVIVNDTTLVSSSEKEILLNILNDWKHGNYQNGVQAHNYVWGKLGGEVGKAKDLRPEYKK